MAFIAEASFRVFRDYADPERGPWRYRSRRILANPDVHYLAPPPSMGVKSMPG
jgi:hypothetical protein